MNYGELKKLLFGTLILAALGLGLWAWAPAQAALSPAGGDKLAALLIAGFLEMLVLPQLLGQPFLLARLLEAAEKLLHILTGPAFYSYHAHPQNGLRIADCGLATPTTAAAQGARKNPP